MSEEKYIPSTICGHGGHVFRERLNNSSRNQQYRQKCLF
jgi:hypothetical protein